MLFSNKLVVTLYQRKMMKKVKNQGQYRRQARISKREMDRYQAKMKLGKEETPSAPAGDSTRSEE
jgi:hypothetical protein